jgi:hypothetical protein
MGMPIWVTPGGNLGVIADGVYFTFTFVAEDTGGSPLTYTLVSGSLPVGLVLTTAGVLYGAPEKNTNPNETQAEFNQDVYSKFVIRATNNLGIVADKTFEITVTGESPPTLETPTGSLGTFYSGQYIDIQLQAVDIIPEAVITFSIYAGNLPPGITLSPTGLLSGYVQSTVLPGQPIPNFDESPYDSVPFDFVGINQDLTYAFTVQVSDGISYTTGSYSVYIISRESLTADNTEITADAYPDPTADSSNLTPPYITTPAGNIGTTYDNDYFTYRFSGYDPDGDTINFMTGNPLLVNTTFITCDTTLYTCDETATDAIPGGLGLTLDPVTGWLYGTVPILPIATVTYSFVVRAYKVEFPTYLSVPVNFTITVNGEYSDEITWITPTNLGTIDNGAVSTLSVQAESADGITLWYEITPDTASNLPQGLSLFQDGLIAGRASFKFFEFDNGTTTFDNGLTTFGSTYTFTIRAINNKKQIYSDRTFTLKINPANPIPYQDLYLLSFMPEEERITLEDLLNSPSIFPPSMIYRYNDSYFGVASNVNMLVMTGLNPASATQYILAMQENHYDKSMYFGDIKTAIATNTDGSTVYEVVYVELIDPQDNLQGQSCAKSIPQSAFPNMITGTVYPNSIQNMKYQVANGTFTYNPFTADDVIFTADDSVDTADITVKDLPSPIGIANYSTLPLWMTSIQPNGQILGFTNAFVLCYCNPGTSGRILYNVNNFGLNLQALEFKADGYVWDNSLSEYWNANVQEFIEGEQTTFDSNTCTFDQNSTKFFNDEDQYTPLFSNNGFLKFPKFNILE